MTDLCITQKEMIKQINEFIKRSLLHCLTEEGIKGRVELQIRLYPCPIGQDGLHKDLSLNVLLIGEK
jgi:hypothetical protein